jgi:hypothetical protein
MSDISVSTWHRAHAVGWFSFANLQAPGFGYVQLHCHVCHPRSGAELRWWSAGPSMCVPTHSLPCLLTHSLTLSLTCAVGVGTHRVV